VVKIKQNKSIETINYMYTCMCTEVILDIGLFVPGST
jgi:predicted SprT family Zn-dependent metalloprotease